ncbi:hypothetical protein V4890_10275 [Ralstonia solanacearum species complex bacterium KE056]|uniref:hypothetical protein n=1 Tax=Ralstonia solanacearum species complex bacterium KE056 TaxID=3119585 RepID=UPI002FC3111B
MPGKEMSPTADWRRWCRRNSALLAYFFIVAIALLFDVLGDRSFGALMLATLPVALVAVVCLLVGPWLDAARQRLAVRAWFAGTGLVLVITAVFSSIGSEQAKTGELVFTYAGLLMSLPSSLVLPFVMNWAEPLLRDSFVLRLLVTWGICVLAGWFNWWLLSWLRRTIGRRSSLK